MRKMHAGCTRTRATHAAMEPCVNVRLPVSLWELVKAAATAERRSASAELAALVERALRTAVPAKPGADQTAATAGYYVATTGQSSQTAATLADFRAITTTSSASINRRVDRGPAAVAADAVAALEPRSADWRAEVAHRLAGLGGQK